MAVKKAKSERGKKVTTIGVQNISGVTPHNEALYEAGKALLLDSITTAREFSKSMITISTGAIPVYLGILAYLLPEDYTLGVGAGIPIALPAIGFLVAALMFIWGYLPIRGNISLDVIEKIEQERERIMRHRDRRIGWGIGFFFVSTLYAIYTIVINIGVR